MSLTVQLISGDETPVTTDALSIVKTEEAEYYSEITVTARGNHTLVANVYDNTAGGADLGRFGNTPFTVYWDSHYADHETSTISGPALTIVYTGILDRF